MSIATKTFKDAKSALAHAKKLLDDGEISKGVFAKLEKKLVAEDQDGNLRDWLAKTYPAAHSARGVKG